MEKSSTALAEKLKDVAMLATCEQCGRCSSACPLTGKNGFNVRRIVRHVELGLIDEVSDSSLPWSCTTCGRCEDACPNGIQILDAIRILRLLTPSDKLPDGPPCMLACPVNLNIPGYVGLVAEGKVDDAYLLIREKLPFPGIVGRICTRPCEKACRRGEVNDAIAICALKRYVADNESGLWERVSRAGSDTGRKVAIVGAGPAGLTAAFYLRKKGHQVTIFEARSEPGGMMRFGIPAYRLPRDVLQREVNQVLSLGVQLETGKKLGRDFDLDELKAKGYEAVFLAIGAQLSRKISIEGSSLDDVNWGVDFLCSVGEGREVAVKDRVLVIGGGNVAIDVALTARRLGAKEVTVACLESREEMPANPWEIRDALDEGIKLMPSWGPSRILETGGRISGVELIRCVSVFDDKGNFAPKFDDTKQVVQADQVILAIGQASDLSFIDPQGPLKVERGLIVVNQETLSTTVAGIFAGGDVTKAPGSVIEAIAAGRKAAQSIDKFLGGNGDITESFLEGLAIQPFTGRRDKGFADLRRVEMPTVPISERHSGFAEVELGFNADQAIKEASRCLRCHVELMYNGALQVPDVFE